MDWFLVVIYFMSEIALGVWEILFSRYGFWAFIVLLATIIVLAYVIHAMSLR